MKAGEICVVGGQYCCLYHLKNKIKIKKDSPFPTCNFAGLNCPGEWYIQKVIVEKTPKEKREAVDQRRRNMDKRRSRNMYPEFEAFISAPKANKWDFKKW